MCRLFGFRSIIHSQVHKSLVSADNALALQSENHPDGWGIAYYNSHVPHIVKSPMTAHLDHVFKKVSGIVSSNTVLAHLRKATMGKNSSLNTHPFQFGRWVFAHNGNIKDFDSKKNELLKEIHPKFRRYILGETDSEILFYFLLSQMDGRFDLQYLDVDTSHFLSEFKRALVKFKAIAGPFNNFTGQNPLDNFYTMILTDGSFMVAFQGGQPLYYSTHKNMCSDKFKCESFRPECEKPSHDGKVTHLVFSSEILQGENVWLPMTPGQVVAVGPDMKYLDSLIEN